MKDENTESKINVAKAISLLILVIGIGMSVYGLSVTPSPYYDDTATIKAKKLAYVKDNWVEIMGEDAPEVIDVF